MNTEHGRYGLRLEYSTPTRFVLAKEITGIDLHKQARVAHAWRKAIAHLNRKYKGKTAFYLTLFYAP
jgi:hypothetical protein